MHNYSNEFYYNTSNPNISSTPISLNFPSFFYFSNSTAPSNINFSFIFPISQENSFSYKSFETDCRFEITSILPKGELISFPPTYLDSYILFTFISFQSYTFIVLLRRESLSLNGDTDNNYDILDIFDSSFSIIKHKVFSLASAPLSSKSKFPKWRMEAKIFQILSISFESIPSISIDSTTL